MLLFGVNYKTSRLWFDKVFLQLLAFSNRGLSSHIELQMAKENQKGKLETHLAASLEQHLKLQRELTFGKFQVRSHDRRGAYLFNKIIRATIKESYLSWPCGPTYQPVDGLQKRRFRKT